MVYPPKDGSPIPALTVLLLRLSMFLHCIYFSSELRKVLFLALSVTFLFVYEISREPLNGFAPNSQGRRVWSIARMSSKVKVNFGGLCAVYVWKKHLCSSFLCRCVLCTVKSSFLSFLWPPCVADADIIFGSCGFYFLLLLLSLLVLSGRKVDVYHISTHDVALVRI